MLIWLLVLSSVALIATAIDRHYYIIAEDVEWDYAPSGRNQATDDGQAQEKIENRSDRIGSVYTKARYRGFTDDSFTQPLDVPEWAGLVGPLITAETGDMVLVHFENRASGSNFSIHPHGFQYEKGNEGALYIDGTSGDDKLDDAVPQGGSVMYVWNASLFHSPTDDDDNCVAFTYHSHMRAPPDIDSGLMGIGLFCRPGTLDEAGVRRDVDQEFYVYADIADEGLSWYAERNLQRCGDPSICQSLQEEGDDDFVESNLMAHINGFTYGNIPDFNTCPGTKVVWYFMTINLGIHTLHANGQTMVIEGKRTDTAIFTSATVFSGYMKPFHPGRWLLYCRNQDYYDDGILAFLNVDSCEHKPLGLSLSPRLATPIGPPWSPFEPSTYTFTRYYYLAIEEVLWDYAPDATSSTVASIFLDSGDQRIGSVYKKARYIEYTDQTFTVQKEHGDKGEHYGLAGPPIKAEVGDDVKVVVLNRATRPYSFLANGVFISKSNEGAWYKNVRDDTQLSGAIVIPGETREYEFSVPEYTGPTDLNANCITYVYHSAVDFSRDIYSGLFGPLLVCRRRSLTFDGSQIGVDREFFINWLVIDENRSWYIDDNIESFTFQPSTVDKDDSDFQMSNKMRAINGRTFGTLNGLQMCLGDNVQWHMYGLGGQVDHHHFSFEGNNFKYDSRNLDTASVFPGIGRTVTMIPDQTGRNLLRDGQLDFEFEGMWVWYDVDSCYGALSGGIQTYGVTGGVVRRYYVGVVEYKWDYAERKIDPVDGSSLLDPDSDGYIFLRDDPPFLGTIYKKAMYREFTDDTFATEKTRSSDETHLALLGPFIRGNVGDTIEIVFRNLATFPYNIVPRNLVFTDGLPISDAPATQPGQTRTYSYFVPERSGPTEHQPNCVGSVYASRVNPLNDTNSGLYGPLVICNSGILDLAGERHDEVTIEFATGYIIFDENKSNYKDINFASTPDESLDDPDFVESNIYHSINGRIYGNLKGLVFDFGQYSSWYIFGAGSVEDIHTVHTHGQLYLRETSLSLKRDVLEVFAGTYETIEMLGFNPGIWFIHCHVAAHAREGMEAVFEVLPGEGPVPNSSLFGPLGSGRGRHRPFRDSFMDSTELLAPRRGLFGSRRGPLGTRRRRIRPRRRHRNYRW